MTYLSLFLRIFAFILSSNLGGEAIAVELTNI